MARERRIVFGEAVEDYDAVRPGYPDALVDEVIAAAGPGPALEVGAGTGKATVSFAARGVDLTCLEPDGRMAAVLRRNVPGVPVIEESFESWRPDRAYRLLYSAQAWHWVDAARRTDLAWDALAPGGLLALFWNVFLLPDRELKAALAELDARYFPSDELVSRGGWLAEQERTEIKPFAEEWAELGLDDGRFTGLETRRYRRSMTYSTADFIRYQATMSIYRMLEPDAREAVLAETAGVLDARGGGITLTVDTDLALARRA